MKFRVAFMLVVLCALARPSVGQDIKVNHIEVSGTAKVETPADRATLQFSIVGYGSSLRQAVDQIRQEHTTIVRRLQEAGLTGQDLSTSRFYSGENQGKRAFLSSKKDFRAAITTNVTIDNLDLLEPVLYVLSEFEVETLTPVLFSLQDESTFKDKARKLAIANARKKAESMAGELGVTLGPVMVITEGDSWKGGWDQPYGYAGRFNQSLTLSHSMQTGSVIGDSGFLPGNIVATANVQLMFELVQ